MKPFNALMISLVGLFLLGTELSLIGFCSDPQIPWSEDLSATMRLAQQTGKPVLVHFYGDNCPPCRMLEKKAFKDRQLIEAVRENLLAVKINAERDTKTAARFRVNRWPTDIYLFPDGQEIYRNISAQDPTAYEKTVLKVAEKNKRMLAQQRTKKSEPSRAELMAMQATPPAPSAKPLETTLNSAASVTQANQEVLANNPPVAVQPASAAKVRLSEQVLQSMDAANVSVDDLKSTSVRPSKESQDPPAVVEAPAPTLPDNIAPIADSQSKPTPAQPSATPELPSNVAMNGFCPVSLALAIQTPQSASNAAPAWVKGKTEFAVRHRGRVYHCASQESLARFLENPDQYAPVLSGCDLVEYSKSGKWIDGDCRFGFIDKETGRIFLFSSSLNCAEFAQNCESYSSMVGKPTGH